MQKDEYVLILGAGLMQRPAIEAAREAGYRTLVIDADPEAVCASYADVFVQIDLKDRDGIASLAQKYKDKLAAVFTAGTDFSANTAFAAAAAGLPGHRYEAAVNASDKGCMRRCFEKESVPSPRFQTIYRNDIASFLSGEKLNSLNFPKVVKPVDNMGARGCRLVRNKSEFLPALEDAVRNSRTSCAILEDYMEGKEYSIDALVFDGTLTITGFADRHIYFPPYFIETGHTMPSSEDESKRLELIKTFAEGIKALGLTCGAAKADIKYTAQGPMIGEIAARLSGGYMSGWTYPYASGLNLTKEALFIACGKKPEELLSQRVLLPVKAGGFTIYEVPCTKFSAERSWISIPGTVDKITGLEKANGSPFIRNIFTRTKEGDEADFPRNNVQKCGNVISCAPSLELAVESACSAAASIVLRLEPSSPKTDAFLEGKEHSCEKGFPYSAFEIPEELKEKVYAFCGKFPEIREGVKVRDFIGEDFVPDFSRFTDFNYRSILKSIEMFDSICPDHTVLNARAFFRILFRGGLQGILYMNDTLVQNRKK